MDGDSMNNKNEQINSLFLKKEKELDKKVNKFKKLENKKKAIKSKRLDRFEDREFSKIIKKEKGIGIYALVPKVYKVIILFLFIFELLFFLLSIFRKNINLLNNFLLLFIVIGFILTSTILKKHEKKIVSIITAILIILYLILQI